MPIKQVINKVLISVVCFVWVLALFTIWKTGPHTISLGLFLAAAIAVFMWYKNAVWHDIRYVVYISAAYAIIEYCKLFYGELIVKNNFLKILISDHAGRGILDYLFIISLCYALAYAVAKLFTFRTPTKRWLLINILASVGLSLYAAGLMLLDYQSFSAPFYDLGIFDQALHLLSRFQIPASTARQFLNLWHDHQHFSLIFLAPLYWFKPIATYLLIAITPFLLITLPSFILYKTCKLMEKIFCNNGQTKNYYWIIGFSSILLWLHPYTQSAIAFYFHEKYLMPIGFCLIIFTFLKFLQKPNAWRLVMPILITIAWLGIKEDQWLFIALAWLQILIIIAIFARRMWKKTALVSLIGIIVCLIYAFAFLPWFQRDYPGQGYANLYTKSKQALIAFTKNGDIEKLITALDLRDDVQKYTYQNFMVFDLPGMVGLPLNIAANYGERLLSSEYAQKNPIFHYGVDVPIYSVVGILFLMLLLNMKYKLAYKNQAVFFVVLYILGFGSVLGWNNIYYLNPRPYIFITNYKNSSAIRHEYKDIKKIIPPNASLISTDSLSTHFSKRTKIYQYPERIIAAENDPGKNHLETFDYWILRNDVPAESTKASELQNEHYELLYAGQIFLVLKKQ